jgi:Homeodomain-like domain
MIRFGRGTVATEAKMRHQDYVVKLGARERQWLEALAKTGKSSARMQIRARILLHADVSKAGSKWTDQRITAALGCCEALCQRVRKRYAEEGLATAVARKKRETPPVPPIFDGEQEAKLITLACSPPPAGHKRWSLRLLENKVVELHIVDHASDNTIGRVLKKTNLSRISKRTGSFHRNKTAPS